MKGLLAFLLFVVSMVSVAAETKSVAPIDQKPFSKLLNPLDSGSKTDATVALLGSSSVLEIMFSNGLRMEVQELSRFQDGNLVQVQEQERVYGFTWQPRDHLIGVGIETELVERNGRTVLKTRPSLRASTNFEGHNFDGSVFLKPTWNHEENSIGLKVGVRIDF